MAKMYYKKDLSMVDGRVIDPKTNEVVCLPTNVVLQAEKLDLMAQQYDYLKDQGEYHPGPSLDGFKRRSVFDGRSGRPYLEDPETPAMDARVAEAIAYMGEVDKMQEVEDVNAAIDMLGALFDFLGSDHFFEPEMCRVGVVDAPVLGNILELTPEEARAIVETIAKSPVKMEPQW